MATNLTPEQLAEIQRYLSGGTYSGNEWSGRQYTPNTEFNLDGRNYAGGNTSGADLSWAGIQSPAYIGYDRDLSTMPMEKDFDKSVLNGSQYDQYDAQGQNIGQGTWDGLEKGSAMKDAAMAFAVALGGPLLGSALTGAPLLGGAAGAAPATNAMGAGGNFLGSSAGMSAPAGFGSMAGVSAPAGLGAMEAGTGLWGAGAAGLGGAAGGAAGASGAAGGMGSAGSAAASGGGALGSLGSLGSGSNLLGLGATLAGAAAGAQGNEESATQSKEIPEYLKPYVEKMLGYSGGLLDKQMAPGYMQGYDDMRAKGQGLLGRQIAPNGFDRFFPGR